MIDSNESLKEKLAIADNKLAESEKNYHILVDQSIKHAHKEWIASLDIFEDPIFIHDENFLILRCNHAYQLQSGIPYHQIIGHPYFDIFPKTHAPIKNCFPTMEKGVDKGNEQTLQIGDVIYYSRAYSVKDENQNYLYSMHILEDITERIEIQKALQTSEIQYRRLFEAAKDGILILDGDTGLITDANPFILNLTAYTMNDLIGKNLWDIGFIADIAASKISFHDLQVNEYIRYEDLPIKTKDGRLVDVEFVSNVYLVNNKKIIQCSIRDITKRIEIQKALQTSETQYRRLFESAKDGILILDAETGIIVDANPFICNLSGYTFNKMIGKNLWEIGLIEDIAESKISFKELQNNEYIRYDDLPIKTKDGRKIQVEFVSNVYTVNDKKVIQCNIRDITEQMNTREDLKESEEKFHSITRTAQDAILIMNDEGNITYWNESATHIFGYTKEETIGKALHPLLAPKRFHEAYHKGFSHFKKTGEGPAIGNTLELTAIKKDGTEFPIELSLSANTIEGKWEAIGIIRDITERKKAEELLRHANRALKTLSAGNMALVQAQSEDGLLKRVVDVVVKEGGYSMAVVDYAQDDLEKNIIPMAWAELGLEHNLIKEFSWSDTAENQMPVSQVIRTATMQITRNIAAETEFTLWRDAALARGYTASIAFPLIDGDKVFGALNIYSSEVNAFNEEEVRLLGELANDLAYGIITLRSRVADEKHAMILQKSLEQSIQTIAATVESRDPYTAGHQKHVGELATAIATEMGLDEEQVNGIHLAAIIHDLGKIHIPAEILSKPGKLNSIEFMLIQTHPQEGYDILKDVKFPWPIADIILQHHEKLDGSGYPQGLKGDQILLEAKIITVADVVEAISSHRPYRASLGIETALDEIRHGRGIVYDPAVVDACLKLFAKKEFVFSGESL
ncbi:MAG: PAS domain S-box protein [Alphaproteobacteria bacterium]|nr:PAS domain S-box protein [Alphaproteobacteria bacterium]